MFASTSRAVASLALFVLAPACSGLDDGDIDDVEREAEPQVCFGPCEPSPGDVVVAPPTPSDPDLTYVTFYAGPNQTGAWWTVSGKTQTAMPLIQLYDSAVLTSWGLYQNVGSVMIQCGTRPGTVSLLTSANTGLPFEQWSGSGTFVECTPGQVMEVDDVASLTDLQGQPLAGRVRSAVFYAHGATHHPFALDFDGQVLQAWNNNIGGELPSGATVNGEGTIKMVGWAGFELRQNLYLDHWACTKRSGHFVLSGGPKLDLSGNLYWSVTVKETYVNTGFGDSWGCRSGMKSKLVSGASTAAQTLAARLSEIPEAAVPTDGAAYYFAPRESFTKFSLHVGL